MAPAAVKNAESSIAVYCGSCLGNCAAFSWAAISVGRALAAAKRPLVYGGGSSGMMGVVSNAVLDAGGKVTGVMPLTMVKAGGEGDKAVKKPFLNGQLNGHAEELVGYATDPNATRKRNGHAQHVETIIVDSMHERKIEMAKRVEGFIGLPGGYGTFEEVMEVTTWTQLGIHDKPVVLVNVLSFWDPLRAMIRTSAEAGFIRSHSESLVIFVDGPEDPQEHGTFDWGKAALAAVEGWEKGANDPLFDWSMTAESATQEVVYQST